MDTRDDSETVPVMISGSNMGDHGTTDLLDDTVPVEPAPVLLDNIEEEKEVTSAAPVLAVSSDTYLPSVALADQTLDRCVSSASWVHNAIHSKGTRKQKRYQRTRFNHLESVVTRDQNNIIPSESVVYSMQTSTGKLGDSDFQKSDEYKHCTGKNPPRDFTVSVRSGGEIINSIAHSQFNTYNMYSSRNMTPVFLSKSKKSAFGSKREKQSAMRDCFAGDNSLMLMKELEELRDNAFKGFIRAMDEQSPVNMAMAAWVCGRAAANHVLLCKNKMTYSPLSKYEHRGLFKNDGSKTSSFNSSEFLAEINNRSQKNMTFDTATRVFDTRLKIILNSFINTARGADNRKTPAALAAYLRQTRQGGSSTDKSRRVDLSDVISDMPCVGMLTPRNPSLILDEQVIKSDNPLIPLTASFFDETIYGNKRKRKAADDFEQTLAGAIVSASSRAIVGNGAEWSLHITQLFSQAFLETMGSLMACTFGVADPFSDEGIKTIKRLFISEEGNTDTKRIVNNAASASIKYFLKMGNFTVPFVTSDPNDIIEGRRVSPNTPVLFIVTKKVSDEGITSKVFSLRDRLLVNDKFMDRALAENANSGKAASYTAHVTENAPTVGGSLPIIRGPLTTSRNLVDDTKEGLNFDWYIHLSVLSSMGKASAAVAAGISRALSTINTTTKSSSSSVIPSGLSDSELKKAMRRNFDRSKNLLISMGQYLNSWNYEEHNASINSYWTSVSSIRSKALQDTIIRGNELGVAHQIDAGCIRDSFSDAERQLRLAFFEAIDKPGDFVYHLSDVISSYSDRSSGALWKRFVNTIEALPSSARKVFNVTNLIKTANSFKFPVANNKNQKDNLKNVKAASAVIDNLVRMTLQTAFNTRQITEAGSVSDGWSKTTQMEPSRMQALLDLSKYRYSKNTVTIPLNMERGSLGFSDNKRTNVLVLHTVILNHLVADKVALDTFCASEGTTLSKELEKFIDIFTGKKSEVFKDDNRFLTLIRYIWFNVAILSLTDSNVVSVIDMTQDSLGSSIYNDYMAILSLINKYGNDLSHFSIRKLIESYTSINKSNTKNSCFDRNKIMSETQLNTVLKRLTGAVSAFSGDKEAANLNGVKYIDEDQVNETLVTVVVRDVIGSNGFDKISKLLALVSSVVNASKNIKNIMVYCNAANKIPRISDIVDHVLKVSGPARVSRLERSYTIPIDLNAQLRDLVVTGLKDKVAKLNAQPDSKEKTFNLSILNQLIVSPSIPQLVNNIEVPSGLSPNSIFNIINSMDENYPHLDLLSSAILKFNEMFSTYFDKNTTNLSLPVSVLNMFLKNGVIIALALMTTRHGTDFNNAGIDLLSKLLGHVSAETTLALSRLQRTFYPIPPSFLTMSEAFTPSKQTFNCMTDDFIASIIDKIEDTASGIVRCDDSSIASGLAEAGKNFNDSVSKTSSYTTSKTADHIFNPTDIWSKAALPHFDVVVVPRADVTSSDTLKLSAYYHGMATLPASSNPASWSKTLVGNQNYGIRSLPGLGNVCTFNSALDTLLAHPEESCDLISQEIIRSSANVTHNLTSEDVRSSINKSIKAGITAVLEKKTNTKSTAEANKDEEVFRISPKKFSVSDLILSPSSSYGGDSDIVSSTIVYLPVFKHNLIEATKSLFESAAICNVLSKDENVKEASKRIMRIIRETSPVVHKINVNRIAGLIGSISTPRQYNNFLMSVSDQRNMLIRRVNQQSPFCSSNRNVINRTDASKGGGVYLGLLSLGDRNGGSSASRVPLSDRFWMTLFEDYTNFVEDMESESRIYGSKLNSYAAMSSKANRLNESMKGVNKARRARLTSKMGDIETFVMSAALESDPNSALNTLIKAQRTYARLTSAAQMRKNDAVLFTGPIASALVKAASNRSDGSVATQSFDMVEESMTSGILEEIAKGDTDDASSLFMASKLFVARELSKQEGTPETFDYILASSGVYSHAYYLADIICQRMSSEDISLFLGGTMIQRGFFTSFLLNNILVCQISPDLKINDLTDDSKTKLANLIDFCSKMKEALLSMRRNKDRVLKRFSKTDSPDENLRADWAFASSVFSAYNKLRQKDSESRIEMLMLPTVSPGDIATIGPKRRSNLHDVLSAGSTIKKAFITNYCEEAAKSKIVRTANIRAFRDFRRKKFEDPNLMTCFSSGKLFNGESNMDVNGDIQYCNSDDYDMLLDGTAAEDDDMMDTSSSEDEQDSSSGSDYSSSELDDDDDDDDDDDERGNGQRQPDALDMLDSLATPLSQIYSCGDAGYYDDESSTFDKGLRRMVGGLSSDDEPFSDSDNDDSGADESYSANSYRRSRRRAERTIYGPGHLASSSGFIFDNSRQLVNFLTRKKRRFAFNEDLPLIDNESIFSDEEYESTTTDEDDTDTTTKRSTQRVTRRSRTQQSKLVNRAMSQFVPKDIDIDENGRVSLVAPMTNDSTIGFIKNYISGSSEDRKGNRKKLNIQRNTFNNRTEKVSFRRALVKSTAAVLTALNANRTVVYNALFSQQAQTLSKEPVTDSFFFGKQLTSIIEKRNEFIKEISSVAPSLFGCEDSSGGIYNGNDRLELKGYLNTPMEKLASCLKDSKTGKPLSVDLLLAVKDKNHLDWLTSAAIVFARSFNVATGYALENTLKTNTVLKSLYKAFMKLVSSTDGERVKVRSTLLSDIFNTRMVHTDSILGLFYPTAFMNHQLQGTTQEREKLETELLTLVRGVNSRQLLFVDTGDTSSLLNKLTSTKVAGPMGSRGGLSLFRMSLTDTVLGSSPLDTSDGRVKGAVSLEIASRKGISIDDSVFANKTKELVPYCKNHRLILDKASGPIYRYATGNTDIASSLGLSSIPSTDVANDIAAIRLKETEKDSNRGLFLKLSADGNLFGCIDSIARIARKSIETYEAFSTLFSTEEKGGSEEKIKKILAKIKHRRNRSNRTPYGNKSIIRYPGFPSFSDNVLLKAKEFRFSVTTLVTDITKKFSLNMSENFTDTKVSLKSFERILETSAVLANTKTTLRSLENRLQAAAADLEQYKRINDEGLSGARNVIAKVADTLCTLDRDDDKTWIVNNRFIDFAINTELINMKEAKSHITASIAGVHALHTAILEMISSAIHTGVDDNDSLSDKQRQLSTTQCGRYVMHPLTKMLVKSERDDGEESGCSTHQQVALNVLKKIEENKNTLFRARLSDMQRGRSDLRDIMSFNDEDVMSVDNLVRYLGEALASTASGVVGTRQQQKQDLSSSSSSDIDMDNRTDKRLPLKKTISYIPVAHENKQSIESSTTTSKSSISEPSNNTHKYLEQQEAHDLSSILNIISRHKFGEYNQSSVVALFNRSNTAEVSIPGTSGHSSTSSFSLQNPPSAVSVSNTPLEQRMANYISKLSGDLYETEEYVFLSTVYENMAKALDNMSALRTRPFLAIQENYPVIDEATVTVLSQMKALKHSSLLDFYSIMSNLEKYSPDPSIVSKTATTAPIVASINDSAAMSALKSSSNNSSSLSFSASSVKTDILTSFYNKLDAVFEGDDVTRRSDVKDLITKETNIRMTLLLNFPSFTKKIKNIFSMFSDYFKGIDTLKGIINEEAKGMIDQQLVVIDKEMESARQRFTPTLEDSLRIYREEGDAINTSINNIRSKMTELKYTNEAYKQMLNNVTSKINSGTKEVSVGEIWGLIHSSQQDPKFINKLKQFASENSESVYKPQKRSNQEYDNLYSSAVDSVTQGQETLTVKFTDTLSKFPEPLVISPDDDIDDVDLKKFEDNFKGTLIAMEDYAVLLNKRLALLNDRAIASANEVREIENRRQVTNVTLRNQTEERRAFLKNRVSIATNTLQESLDQEVVQTEAMVALGSRVDKIVTVANRGSTPSTVTESARESTSGERAQERKRRLTAEVSSGGVFVCSLEPLHDSIDRLVSMYDSRKSVVGSKVDLQLTSIFDLSMSVLDDERPETVPSGIVPGVCRLCAMMITNLHEASHYSDHSFEFDDMRSRETLRKMLSAAISNSDTPASRYDVLSMMEGNNGHVKEIKFNKKQRVACMTPVNSLLGAYGKTTVQPGTVLLPTSELFSCDGLDHDKFRSMAHRSTDPALADSSKSADSIVETLADTSPSAEMLFYTFKDERRHFNSIPDCILENMSAEAITMYNTQCDQSTVVEDRGLPVFVGRVKGGNVNVKKTEELGGGGGLPAAHGSSSVNMAARYMVAPGSLLNAKKEEMLRLSRVSDVNNAVYNDLDVHVAGSNNSMRIGEIVKAACGGNDMLMETAKKMLLLGSVTAVAQQKASSQLNDPSTLLSSSEVVKSLISSDLVKSLDILTNTAYKQRFFPQICNNLSLDTSSAKAGTVCPANLLGDFKRYKCAMQMVQKNNTCGVFLNGIATIPTSSTPEGIADSLVHDSATKVTAASASNQVASLAMNAMTDCSVDMVSALSSNTWRATNALIPSVSLSGKPLESNRANELKNALSRVIKDASMLQQSGNSISSLNAILNSSLRSSSSSPPVIGGNNDAERLFNAILRDSSSSPRDPVRNERTVISSILDIANRDISAILGDIEGSIEKHRLGQALSDIRNNILVTSDPPQQLQQQQPLSSILTAKDVRSGRLAMEGDNTASEAVDVFKTAPLIVRHTALFHRGTPIPLSSQTRKMLADRTKSTNTANSLLSESMPLLTDVVLHNTRDAPVERAIDRLLLSTFIVKQGKNFDDVDSTLPVALTSATHGMLSAIDSRTSRLISNLKLHVNDTSSILKNVERFEKFMGRYGDEYAMSNRQNCNCPFDLHHDFKASADEELVKSFAYARPEITATEIKETPYQCNKLLSDKHYVMAASKVDARVSGTALYRRVSEWSEMRNAVTFSAAFEPSRLALSNGGFTTAGVNLDVIVRPNNASGVLGILGCHRKHLCMADLKTSVATNAPSMFIDNEKGLASELIQNALPHNKYIQKSRINSASVIFTNILEKTIKDLSIEISKDLSSKLLDGEFSVTDSVMNDTQNIMNKLLDVSTVTNGVSRLETSSPSSSSPDISTLTSDIVTGYAKKAMRNVFSCDSEISVDSVPFSSAANGSVAFDFLMSSDPSAKLSSAKQDDCNNASNSDRSMISRILEAISNRVSDAEFSKILDDIENKIKSHEFADNLSGMDKDAKQRWQLGLQELSHLLSFMKILKTNIAPALSTGELGEKMRLFISLISAKSRLENLLRYGMSNSSSVDLSHLKPLNSTAVTKNIEDTFTYRNVPPVFIMAMPENFSALFQQEQSDPDFIIDNRRSLTSFLNHPNTSSMARTARASVGAGGGNAMGIYPSSLLLQESTVLTAEPVVDTDNNYSFYSKVTQDPMMFVDPFKDSAGLAISSPVIANGRTTNTGGKSLTPCSYLQVSMPTQFSGLVTNTGLYMVSDEMFAFKRRDGSVVNLNKIKPAVLCSDASTNLLDEFARADTVLEDMEVRFGFMPEILNAIAKVKGTNTAEVIKEMANQSGSSAAMVDRGTGDVVVRKSGMAFPFTTAAKSKSNGWGNINGLLRGKLLPNFIASNPLGAASVNGIPITPEGEYLATLKRNKTAGISLSPVHEDDNEFGKGVVSEAAIRSLGGKLSSELKPLKEVWDKILKLQATLSKTAVAIRDGINNKTIKNPGNATAIVRLLYKDFDILRKCKNLIRDTTSRLVATSDLMTGGFGGDHTVAMVSPYKTEQFGVIGALSSGVQMGIGSLISTRSKGIEALRTATKEQITLNSGRGKCMPEHGNLSYDLGDELLTDHDSIFSLMNKRVSDEPSTLNGVVDSLVKTLDKSKELTSSASYPVARHESVDNDASKRRAIAKLLSENPLLLNSIANTMYFGNEGGSKATETASSSLTIKYGGLVALDNANKDHLNDLFTTNV